jgi:cell division transport system ATP-binding protein
MPRRGLNTLPTEDIAAGPVLDFQGVGMRYGRAPEVLRDISLTLHPGSFHFLTGASGAGKSSLLKLIYLAHGPSRGLIRLFGQDIATLPRAELPWIRRRIGVVFQEYRLLDHLSAFDNAALPLRIAGRNVESYRADVAELLSWVGLGNRMHALPVQLDQQAQDAAPHLVVEIAGGLVGQQHIRREAAAGHRPRGGGQA